MSSHASPTQHIEHISIQVPATNNYKTNKQIKKSHVHKPFTTDSQENLSKHMRELYSESSKKLRKEIKEDLKKRRHILCSRADKFHQIKMSIVRKWMNRFYTIPVKNLSRRFCRQGLTAQKFMWKGKETRRAK